MLPVISQKKASNQALGWDVIALLVLNDVKGNTVNPFNQEGMFKAWAEY